MVEGRRWLAAGVLVGALGCGDDSGGGDSDPGPTSSPTGHGDHGSHGTDDTGSNATTSDPATTNATSGPGQTDATTATTESTAGDTSRPDDSGGDDSGAQGGGTIDVTLSGCDIDLGGTVVVSYNGSLGVASIYDMGATLTGSFQFDLDVTAPDSMELSSQHRVDTGNVLNLVDTSSTWTNLDADALSGQPDTIGGTLVISAWDPAAGISELEFDNVSLRNVSDGGVCTVNGTIVTTELYP